MLCEGDRGFLSRSGSVLPMEPQLSTSLETPITPMVTSAGTRHSFSLPVSTMHSAVQLQPRVIQ